MSVLLTYSDALSTYDFGPSHPLRPERFTLAVELMCAYGLLDIEMSTQQIPAKSTWQRAHIAEPQPASREDLQTVHDNAYLEAVTEASRDPLRFRPHRGIGPGDTPAFHGMHEAAALACGATTMALRAVVEGDAHRAFSVAGGLHHAHRDRAAGFCVYNDPAVAIAVMRRDHPGLRVAYVDIDAHHGDGVEEAFYEDPDVLTISIHESGRYLFPGTGRIIDTGQGKGKGFAINGPLPPLADDVCYRLVLHEVIAPALAAYAPDVIVAQCGADTLHTDPLTHLGLTLHGYRELVTGLISIADDVCKGRICVTGGGGYDTYCGVPRAWTLLLASLLGVDLPDALPEAWRERVRELTGTDVATGLLEDDFAPMPGIADRVRAETVSVIERVRHASPLITGGTSGSLQT